MLYNSLRLTNLMLSQQLWLLEIVLNLFLHELFPLSPHCQTAQSLSATIFPFKGSFCLVLQVIIYLTLSSTNNIDISVVTFVIQLLFSSKFHMKSSWEKYSTFCVLVSLHVFYTWIVNFFKYKIIASHFIFNMLFHIFLG